MAVRGSPYHCAKDTIFVGMRSLMMNQQTQDRQKTGCSTVFSEPAGGRHSCCIGVLELVCWHLARELPSKVDTPEIKKIVNDTVERFMMHPPTQIIGSILTIC